jgi:hypothetical protein
MAGLTDSVDLADRGGERCGPGPVAGQAHLAAALSAYEPGWDGEKPVARGLRLGVGECGQFVEAEQA